MWCLPSQRYSPSAGALGKRPTKGGGAGAGGPAPDRGRRVGNPRLFQLHDLVAAVADVKLIVKAFPALQLAVVVGDELADMGGQQSFGRLLAGDLDPGGR